MSGEGRLWVRLVRDNDLDRLLGDAGNALRRAEKAMPGDRTEGARFEALASQIELEAHAARQRAAECTPLRAVSSAVAASPGLLVSIEALAHSGMDAGDEAQVSGWIDGGDLAIELRLPFLPGLTEVEFVGDGPTPSAEEWKVPGSESGRKAVLERFRGQVAHALDGADLAVICPSGVSNSVLTKVLRTYAVADDKHPALDIPIVYRDGSRGLPFPFRSLQLRDSGEMPERILNFALLSIRHTEMDAMVDGAWLRNSLVSRPRPAGDTDQLVYELSRAQLRSLTDDGPVTIFMHQTGLETAILGFYRAVAHELRDRPGSLAVVPRFFQSDRSDTGAQFSEGTPWMT